MQLGDYSLASELKEPHGLRPGYSWKVVKELLERDSGFQVIEQSLDRDSGTTKDRRTTHDRRIDGHDIVNALQSGHDWISLPLSLIGITYGRSRQPRAKEVAASCDYPPAYCT